MPSVRGLDGMEFIFFIAYGAFYFKFMIITALIIYQCLSYCWTVLIQHQGLLCFSLCSSSE